MEHLVKQATVVHTDKGEFKAIAAAWTVDRQGEQIRRGAFSKSIAKWQQSGKRIPVHWNHQGEAHNVIGSVDPASMREVLEGLLVEGRLNLAESEVAREAWRSMRENAVSLSFGFLATKSRKRGDGVRELQEIDLFEISVVPHPANPDTGFLELKSVDNPERVREETAKWMYDVLTSTDLDEKALERERKRAAPIQIATFVIK